MDHYIAIVDCGRKSGDEEPKTFVEAVGDLRRMKAIHEEMDSIQENGTWILVDLPPRKTRVNGTHVKHKTRLVARGCKQVEDLDYEDTFALVVKWGTFRALVALVAHYECSFSHLDVKTTFLNGKLKEEVYVV